MITLTDFEIDLLRKLQEPLELCPRPFLQIAQSLGCCEDLVLEAVKKLKSSGIIRRFRASINYRTLGRIASLVCAHIPNEKFDAAAKAVNRLKGVSHSYCRDHYFNLWFTLQAASLIAVDVTLSGLAEDFDIEFHSLPAVRLFKLDVRFDPAGPASSIVNESSAVDILLPDIPPVPPELSDNEKLVLAAIQNELPITECPFESYEDAGTQDILPVIQILHKKNVLTKFSAVLDYKKLGYFANCMLCIEVPLEQIGEIGPKLASINIVSHCYQRKTFAGWPFNLYAMCHSANMDIIETVADSFSIQNNLPNYQLLPTLTELKKEPVKI